MSVLWRAGIIGCGFIGVSAPDNHLQAYLECESTDLIALCDTQLEKLQAYSLYRQYTEAQPMAIIERLDIVSICTPPETHKQLTCLLAPYVKAIYLEKPIAPTLEEADEIIMTCLQNNVILQVNHQRNFMNPKFRYSRGAINTGTHMFALIKHLFRDEIKVDIERVDTEEPVFELDCTHNQEPMIIHGVRHLVECLNENKQSIMSGVEAREALRLALEEERNETPND